MCDLQKRFYRYILYIVKTQQILCNYLSIVSNNKDLFHRRTLNSNKRKGKLTIFFIKISLPKRLQKITNRSLKVHNESILPKFRRRVLNRKHLILTKSFHILNGKNLQFFLRSTVLSKKTVCSFH